MGRKIEISKNPAQAFLEWRSSEKCFRFWDKEKEQHQFVPLPFKFLWLREYTTIKGFSDNHQGGIWSNEISSFNQPLKVSVKSKLSGGIETIAEGLYKDIKEKLKSAGGRYTKSVYVMTPKGAILNLQLTGAAFSAWLEFTKKTQARLQDEWIEVTDVVEGKKGATVFYTPDFKFSGSLTNEEAAKADEAFKPLEDYLEVYFKPTKAEEIEASIDLQVPPDFVPEEVPENVEPLALSDDLPF